MDPYITGNTIRALREKAGITQSVLAQRLYISDKTVSKWETGKSLPDLLFLEPIASVFHVSVSELLSGETIENTNISANMNRCRFYVCPICGNILQSVGEASITCHGIALPALEAETDTEDMSVTVETVEDEYYIHIGHPMTKEHFISFIAAVSSDRIQFVKLYPEGNAETRFKMNGVRCFYFYCNRDGLFKKSAIIKQKH